jgi:ribose transport system permease protein
MGRITKFLREALTGPLAALILAVVVISFTTDRFLDLQNLMNVSLQVSTVAIVAIGATLVILTAGIDLSSGSILGLMTCVLAILVKNNGMPLLLGIFLVLVLSSFLGLINGILSTYVRIPSFIVTLSTMSIYRGLSFLITNGSPIFTIDPMLLPMFYGKILNIPLPFIYVVVFYAAAIIFLRYTVPGRSVYAIGGNASAAHLSGVHVNRIRLLTFVLAGLMAGIGGILLAARLNSGSPNYGVGTEMGAIGAAVIGGASLAGGYGNMFFTLIGAVVVAVVQNGLNLNAVPAAWQEITLGAIIAFAVGLDMWKGSITFGKKKVVTEEVQKN